MRVLVLLLFFGLFTCSVQAKEADDEKIRELMSLMGTEQQADFMWAQMKPLIRQAMADAPPELTEEIFRQADIRGMLEMIVPIYRKHFTAEEITQLIAFFKSPLGEKLIEKQPEIMRESSMVGQRWGQTIAEKVLKQMSTQ